MSPPCELLNRGVHFTALVCYDDIAAIGAIRAIRDHGLHVPEDISVVGFDDIRTASYHNPSLTTIRQPLHQMGATAARILLQRIRGARHSERSAGAAGIDHPGVDLPAQGSGDSPVAGM